MANNGNAGLIGSLSKAEALTGAISSGSVSEQLTGSLAIPFESLSLTGELSPDGSLSGAISGEHSLTGEMTVPKLISVDAEYDGSYSVTPKVASATVLATKNKVMRNDVTVYKVPIWETSNDYGTTVIIGDNYGS